MYASILPTERHPVAMRIMIAEANTDAPKPLRGAPDGTGYRDMARSESSAQELGRPVPRKRGAGVGWAVVARKRVMTVERRDPACMASQTKTAEGGAAEKARNARKADCGAAERVPSRTAGHRLSGARHVVRAEAGVRTGPRGIAECCVPVKGRLRKEMCGCRPGRGRRAASPQWQTRGIGT